MKSTDERSYDGLVGRLSDAGVDVASAEERLRSQKVETPSWGYGDTGTRFAVFPQRGCRVTRSRRWPTPPRSTG